MGSDLLRHYPEPDGDGWGKCKKQGYATTKGSNSCDEWK